MGRVTIIAALLAVLVGLAEASIYRTTITTTTIEEDNPSQSERCRRQIGSRKFNECQRYLQQSQRGLLLSKENNQNVPRQCCQQLEQVNEECRCEAVRQIVQQMPGGYQGEEMQETLQRAERLPSMCGMEPQQCQIRGRGY